MKTKEVIRQLMEADPSGDEEVCVENIDIHFIGSEPAYYDGALQVLKRDENCKYYNIVGAKYVRSGKKIVIHTHSIHDAICNRRSMEIDYSELPVDRQESTKKAHEDLRTWLKDMRNSLEQETFAEWAKAKAACLTEDIEDIVDTAKEFYKNNLSADDSLPEGGVPLGMSYNDARKKQWDSSCEVKVVNGFLEISEI